MPVYGPTLEDQREYQRIHGSWNSPWYPILFFLVAMPIEWWLWRRAPFMQFGWQIVLGLTIVLAAVPWIGSRSPSHAADSAALRRHPARFAFLLPMVLLHVGVMALYGPYWRSGPGDATVTINRVLVALGNPQTMADLLVEAVARTGEREVLRDVGFLRRLGADVNARGGDGRYPLDAVALPDVLVVLLDAGARAHGDQIAVQLQRVIDAGDMVTLERLLALGIDPDLVAADDASGITAAQWAARWGYVEALESLLAAGARLDHRDGQGRTVLDHARDGGDDGVLAVIARYDGRVGNSPGTGPEAD